MNRPDASGALDIPRFLECRVAGRRRGVAHTAPRGERAQVLLEILQWQAAQHDSSTTTYNW